MKKDNIQLENGKYTLINGLNKGGRLVALRHGEEWRDLSGDKLILAMYHRIEELEALMVRISNPSPYDMTSQLEESYRSGLKEGIKKGYSKALGYMTTQVESMLKKREGLNGNQRS